MRLWNYTLTATVSIHPRVKMGMFCFLPLFQSEASYTPLCYTAHLQYERGLLEETMRFIRDFV